MDSDDVAFEYETVWLDANRYYEVEGTYYELLVAESKKRTNPNSSSKQSAKRNKRTPVGRIVIKGISQSSLASEIAYARQKIQNFLKASDLGVEAPLKQGETMMSRLEELEQGYESIIKRLDKLTGEVQGALEDKDARLKAKRETKENEAPKKEEKKDAVQNGSSVAAEDDNDIDLFGSDEELDAAAVKLKEERLEAYKNKKAEKPAIIAKSGVLLDVKPWDDETDMVAMEKAVRNIICDGLFWGGGKLVPLAYGIKKLQIVAIVEDEKCSVDWLTETICGIEDLVQSVDIASFYKL